MTTSSESVTLTVIRNDPDSGPGRILDWAASEGVEIDLIKADEGDQIPSAVDQLDAVVMLGGGFLPDVDEEKPWLPAERALVRDCIDRQVPVLGICLGAQLLAHVGGGRVEGDFGMPEKGVTELVPQPDAADDELFREFSAPTFGIESHRDQITALPDGARLLMSSERCRNQAFRLGDRAWATQWHPESSAERVGTWNDDKLRDLGFDAADVKRTAQQHGDELESTWRAFFGRFLDVVRTPRAPR
ncbi:aminotransferase [Flexivirga endophytica]|uniref:Aminotransferase n=1 Tax=Flexivirga endophytica TaxID=1849103 RepID=A0A916WPD0_9MICO|nr:type 1 glutamine amidotransferase [Flexivirga endophytica]GGB17067.1 aminotransferase [Flexivirga endophytica]GHB38502.1 aminotransferase [Flexivirga endophytica]